MKSYGVTIQMKATEQYFTVELFIMPYEVVLICEPVDEIVRCDHSHESYWVVFSCSTLWCDQSNESYFPVVLYIMLYMKWVWKFRYPLQ